MSLSFSKVCFRTWRTVCWITWAVMLVPSFAAAQTKPTARPKAPPASLPGAEYSGMYSFLREGEFVQISIESGGKVTGFISRYGDSESDRGDFLEHFFKSGKLDGGQLVFASDTVHGIFYEFRGSIERGAGKKPGDEGYYVLKGSLVENTVDDAKKVSSRSREVALKSFPQDMGSSTGP